MIRIRFRTQQGQISGFTLSGHAGAGAAGEDVVCAAVSSAAYMTVNTVTDVLHVDAHITVRDGYMDVTVDEPSSCQAVFSGFRLHMQAIQDQYPSRVQFINTEV